MKDWVFDKSNIMRYLLIGVATVIVAASLYYANRLAGSLEQEERRKMEIWAEATRQFILADEHTDIDFISSVIEGNTDIPVYMTDGRDSVLSVRNVPLPRKKVVETYQADVQRLKAMGRGIEVRLDDRTLQYIYYDDSLLLKRLHSFPYIQFGVIFLYLMAVLIAFMSIKKVEQNRVWIGLSKETAHQLGTPISSLLAWMELLKAEYPGNTRLAEMDKDVNRLRTIAERFSKIGSQPELQVVGLREVLDNAVDYMRSRVSRQVTVDLIYPPGNPPVDVMVNPALFEWVVENICKNAIDAMDGIGSLRILVTLKEHRLHIDFTDTGKGIERSKFKAVFKPGYTTKKRGWGLGLSLAKRIIEEYHKGRIYVKHSELGVGTTFRINLPIFGSSPCMAANDTVPS